MMKSRSLKFRILFGVIVSCSFSLVMGMFIYVNILKVKKDQDIMLNAERKILSVKVLQSQIVKMESGIKAYLLGGRTEDLKPFSDTEGLFDIQIKRVKDIFKNNKKQIKELDEILKIKEKWIESAAVGEMLARRKLVAGMINFNEFSSMIVSSKGNRLIEDLKDKVNLIVGTFEQEILEMKSNISYLVNQILIIVLIGTILTVLVSFSIQFFMLRVVNGKFINIIKNLLESSEKLRQAGEYSKKESLGLKDECGSLSSGLESNAVTIEEIRAMVKRTSDNTDDSMKFVDSSQTNSVEGRNLLRSIESSFKEIRSSNVDIEKVIGSKLEQINKSLKAIDRIAENTELINDIVFQTKLLSFNASVEAARAGEHGKGFAVVANEIGNLAKVSGESATKIENIITEAKVELDSIIGESLDVTSGLFRDNRVKLDSGSTFVEKCSLKFEEILDSINSVGESFREINLATEEQVEGVKDISQSATSFELTSKNCLLISGNSLDNAELLEGEIGRLNHEINHIKDTIFGKEKGKLLKLWKKRASNNEIGDSQVEIKKVA